MRSFFFDNRTIGQVPGLLTWTNFDLYGIKPNKIAKKEILGMFAVDALMRLTMASHIRLDLDFLSDEETFNLKVRLNLIIRSTT